MFKPFSLLVSLVICLVLAVPASISADAFYRSFAEDQSSYALKVLFIGNSILFVGETPEILVSLIRSNSSNTLLKVAEVGGPNFTLQNHLDEGLAKRTIEQKGPWDYVIIQQHSSELINNQKQTIESAKVLVAAARNARAVPLLYETFGGGVGQYYGYAHKSALAVCQQLGIDLVPVATTLAYVHQQDPQLALFQPDGNHLSDAGVYVAASVLYCKLLRKNPSGLTSSVHAADRTIELSSRDSRMIQDIAWRVVNMPATASNAGQTQVVQRAVSSSAPKDDVITLLTPQDQVARFMGMDRFGVFSKDIQNATRSQFAQARAEQTTYNILIQCTVSSGQKAVYQIAASPVGLSQVLIRQVYDKLQTLPVPASAGTVSFRFLIQARPGAISQTK